MYLEERKVYWIVRMAIIRAQNLNPRMTIKREQRE
jgi:hypothetical protein